MASIPKKKREMRGDLLESKRNAKVFCDGWLENPTYKDWLAKVENDPTKCKCIACNTTLLCGSSELNKHASGKKHEANVRALKITPSVASSYTSKPMTDSTRNVKTAEIKLTISFFC